MKLLLTLLALSALAVFASADTATFGSGSFAVFEPLTFVEGLSTVSIAFATGQPSGLILYQPGLNGKDFFSLELISGQVVLRWNCGSGAGQLTSTASGLNDFNWHTVTATLQFKDASLSVDGSAPQLGTSPGSLISVNTTGSLYVGGIPAGVTPQADSITQTAFAGCLRSLVALPLSTLINFNSALWSNLVLGGCGDSAEFVASLTTGGFLRLPRLRPFDYVSTEIKLSFRTSSPDGLLLYQPGLNSKDFLSLELVGGRVVFKWNPGSGAGTLTSNEASLNDGKWHRVAVSFLEKSGSLAVDGNAAVTGLSLGNLIAVNTTGDFFLGGLPAGVTPQADSITQTAFEGCIRDVAIPRVSGFVDLKNDAIAASVALYSCISHATARFRPMDSFVQFPSMFDNAVSSNEVSFSFKTVAANGLFFYQHGLVKDFVSAEIVGGRVVFKWNPGSGAGVITSTASALNDGQWHTVRAGWLQKDGWLRVDGNIQFGSSVGPLISTNSTTPLLVGGIDPTFTPHAGAISFTTYDGCIRNFKTTPVTYVLDFDADAVKSSNVEYNCGFSSARFGPSSVAVFDPIVPSGFEGHIHLSFSTTIKNGLLAYQPGLNNRDFVSLEVVDEHVVFKWNPGSGRGLIVSTAANLADNKEHSVSAYWNQNFGSLSVDNGPPSTGFSVGPLLAVNTTGYFFVGGLSGVTPQPDSIDYTAFVGCISSVFVSGANGYLDFQYDSVAGSFVSATCPNDVVTTDASSYIQQMTLQLRDDVNSLSIDIRTTTLNGLVLYQGGIFNDFLSIELVAGNVVFKWNPGSGAGVIVHPQFVSDGHWHTITAEWTGKNGLLTIDNVSTLSGTSVGPLISVNVTGALYVAGITPGATVQANTITQTTFTGCLGNLIMNGAPILTSQTLTKSVVATSCAAPMIMKALPVAAPVLASSQDMLAASDSRAASPATVPVAALVAIGAVVAAVGSVAVAVAIRRRRSFSSAGKQSTETSADA